MRSGSTTPSEGTIRSKYRGIRTIAAKASMSACEPVPDRAAGHASYPSEVDDHREDHHRGVVGDPSVPRHRGPPIDDVESARQDRPRPTEVGRDDEESKDRLPERDDALRQPEVSGKGGWQEEGERRHEDEPSALSDPGWSDRLRSTRTVGFG